MNLIPDPFEDIWADKNGIGGDMPDDFPTKEQADKILRDMGYDPVQIGLRGKAFAELCMKVLALTDDNSRLTVELAAMRTNQMADEYNQAEGELVLPDVIQQFQAQVAELQAELAEVRERERWVPVGERLPRVGEYVHVWGRARGECAPGIPYAPAMGRAYFDGEQWQQSSWYTDDVDITHWRGLPAAPEVEP